jgi:hypothetical protein
LAAVEELGGGDAQARRGEEENGDECREDRARASAFYRGWREVEVPEELQWPTMNAAE